MSHQFDLVVIGAGVLGTFHAFHAARLGKRVLLIEKDQYPVGATVRNFGQVVPSAMASDWFAYGIRGTEIYREIQDEFDITVRNNGSVYIASDQEELKLIHELKAVMDDRNYGSVLLSTQQCQKKWPVINGSYCKEALFFPDEVSVEPEKMISRLLQYAQVKYHHLTYKPSTTIVDCSPAGSGVVVTTMNGEKFETEKVIICNGGEFKLLFSTLFRDSGIVISKLQMMRTVPLPGIQLEGNILTGLTIRRYESFAECPSYASIQVPEHLRELTQRGIHILFKKAADGSIIVGDSHDYAEVYNADDLGFGISHRINELMLAEASRIVDFDVRQIAASWSGFYPQHPEKGIVEYDLEDRIHIRTAIGGKGMTSSAGYAEASIRKIFGLS